MPLEDDVHALFVLEGQVDGTVAQVESILSRDDFGTAVKLGGRAVGLNNF